MASQVSDVLVWRQKRCSGWKAEKLGSSVPEQYLRFDDVGLDRRLNYLSGEGAHDAFLQRLNNECLGRSVDIVLELRALRGMYGGDPCRWYGSPSNESIDSDSAQRCENETFCGFPRASYPHHPKRRVFCSPPQSRVVLLRDTVDPSCRWCACVGLKIDACACL